MFSVLKHLSVRMPDDRRPGRLPRVWRNADDQWNSWFCLEVPGLISLAVCPGEVRDDRWFTLGQSDRTHLWFTSPDYAFNAGVPFTALHLDPDQCLYTQLDQHDLGVLRPDRLLQLADWIQPNILDEHHPDYLNHERLRRPLGTVHS
ncbi:hypothetical protein [Euzebya rosea]|uniref:hypothetical protein n=1 Tax=Euzebya rosea TaxID=2052804 RepID=UPI001300216C|nr:hypothetical protein [Euzebya rosea]